MCVISCVIALSAYMRGYVHIVLYLGALMSVCLHVCVCLYDSTFIWACACMRKRVRTLTFVCMYICLCVFQLLNECICGCSRMCMCVYLRDYVFEYFVYFDLNFKLNLNFSSNMHMKNHIHHSYIVFKPGFKSVITAYSNACLLYGIRILLDTILTSIVCNYSQWCSTAC